MKIAFPTERRNDYRLLGPVVERALARGWDTECCEAARESLKARRALERRQPRPTFRQGRPRVRAYAGGNALCRLADFPVDPAARTQYVETFVGPDDGEASDRLLDLVASMGESRTGAP